MKAAGGWTAWRTSQLPSAGPCALRACGRTSASTCRSLCGLSSRSAPAAPSAKRLGVSSSRCHLVGPIWSVCQFLGKLLRGWRRGRDAAAGGGRRGD
eukprot:1184607-Prorocentrum_minimum.AAC.2